MTARRCLALLLFSSAGAFSADPLADVLARMDKSARNFAGMTAELRDDDFVAEVSDHDIHSGTVKFWRKQQNDTRVLIDFKGPNAQTISLDATEARVYYPMARTVQVYDIGGKRGLIDQFLLLGFGATSAEIRAAYDVSWVGAETVNGQASGHIHLVPKSADVLRRLKAADLWISDATGLPVQQKFFTSGTDYKLATYSNVKVNPSLSDKDLRLNPPKGVEIKQVGK